MNNKKTAYISIAFCLLLGIASVEPGQAQSLIFNDGFESGDTSGWDAVVGLAPKAFRFSDLDLRDPHLFLDLAPFGCFDFTDDPLPIVDFSFNESVEEQLNGDADGDEILDLTSLLLFRPLNQMAMGEQVDFDDGMCRAPVQDTVCFKDPTTEPLVTSYDGVGSGTCLEALEGTTSGYSPAIDVPMEPCFITVAETATVQLGDVLVTFEDLQFAATFTSAALGFDRALGNGLIRGFLSEADANAILLPDDLPIVGGQPLSLLLPGGMGNCASGDDRDMHEGVVGWWFYLNYAAQQVKFFGG